MISFCTGVTSYFIQPLIQFEKCDPYDHYAACWFPLRLERGVEHMIVAGCTKTGISRLIY